MYNIILVWFFFPPWIYECAWNLWTHKRRVAARRDPCTDSKLLTDFRSPYKFWLTDGIQQLFRLRATAGHEPEQPDIFTRCILLEWLCLKVSNWWHRRWPAPNLVCLITIGRSTCALTRVFGFLRLLFILLRGTQPLSMSGSSVRLIMLLSFSSKVKCFEALHCVTRHLSRVDSRCLWM